LGLVSSGVYVGRVSCVGVFSMIIAGIDPGANGGMVLLTSNGTPLYVLHVPKIGKEINKGAWKLWASPLAQAEHIFIEQVSAMPGQGVTSMFNFGVAYGFVQALAFSAGAPVSFIRPQEWKKLVGIPVGSDKSASRIRASQLFPNDADKWARVKDDGLAEAALIAYAGMLKLRGEK
jgi:crossover junction endodeoxyribonuclease RuvC